MYQPNVMLCTDLEFDICQLCYLNKVANSIKECGIIDRLQGIRLNDSN